MLWFFYLYLCRSRHHSAASITQKVRYSYASLSFIFPLKKTAIVITSIKKQLKRIWSDMMEGSRKERKKILDETYEIIHIWMEQKKRRSEDYLILTFQGGSRHTVSRFVGLFYGVCMCPRRNKWCALCVSVIKKRVWKSYLSSFLTFVRP